MTKYCSTLLQQQTNFSHPCTEHLRNNMTEKNNEEMKGSTNMEYNETLIR